MDLVGRDADAKQIAGHLDALAQPDRIAELHALGGRDQARLYELAADAPPLDLSFFVPPGVAEDTEVIHYGKNSQPAFRTFQKRFSRPTSDEPNVFGYNETVVRPLIGPGYFVAHPTADGGHDPRGGVVVDYFMVPEGRVPAGWPEVRANHQGLQRFVYHKTRDYMRRLSEHCSIGVAYRLEKRVMGYFVLCRDEAADRERPA